LGALGARAAAAVPHLAHALTDRDPFVARDAAEALGKIGPAAGPALRHALTSQDRRVRLRALFALSQCCAKERPTVIALVRMLKEDADPEVRRWATLALDRIGLTGHGLIANLTAALSDKDTSVRISAAVALGSYGAEAKEAVERLTPLAKGDNAALQAAATEALKKITAVAAK